MKSTDKLPVQTLLGALCGRHLLDGFPDCGLTCELSCRRAVQCVTYVSPAADVMGPSLRRTCISGAPTMSSAGAGRSSSTSWESDPSG